MMHGTEQDQSNSLYSEEELFASQRNIYKIPQMICGMSSDCYGLCKGLLKCVGLQAITTTSYYMCNIINEHVIT